MPLGVPTGPLRAPGNNALASSAVFTDEVAIAAGKDPVQFRRELLGEPAWSARGRTASIPVACAACSTSSPRSPAGAARAAQGHGMGVSCHYSHLGYVAVVVQVTVKDGKVKIRKVWAAADVGRQIVNPNGADQQVQGSVLDGIGSSPSQEITIENGAAKQGNFNDLPAAAHGRRAEGRGASS
jgi:isoquinoline 1-oxidoreductase beta subunit